MTALSNLFLRLISAVILLLIVALSFFLGSTAVQALCGLVISILFWEIMQALGASKKNQLQLMLPIFGMLVPFFVNSNLVTLVFLLIIIGTSFHPAKFRWFRLLALLYIFIALYLFLTVICEISDELNIQQPIFLLGIAIASDSGGYIVGKLVGKRKLTPKISPNKTWEGSFGSIIFGIIFWFLFFEGFAENLILEIVLVILLCVCAQFGDFIESFAKRKLSLKESGVIIPGHGGLFDRIDSIVGVTFGYSVIINLGFGI